MYLKILFENKVGENFVRYSDHVVVSVSIAFPLNSKRDSPFHCMACDYSLADWDGLRDHLRDVP